MIIITNLLFWILLGFICFRFIRLLIKLKKTALFPITEEDLKAIRRQPQKAVNWPVISHQKSALLVMGVTILLLLILVLDSTIQYPYFIIPLIVLINFNQLWNLFAIIEDGVLCGGRLVRWKSIQSYEFEGIHMNHALYGYSPEVNSAYELKLKTKYSTVSCIVTSEAVKEKLTGILARLS